MLRHTDLGKKDSKIGFQSHWEVPVAHSLPLVKNRDLSSRVSALSRDIYSARHPPAGELVLQRLVRLVRLISLGKRCRAGDLYVSGAGR